MRIAPFLIGLALAGVPVVGAATPIDCSNVVSINSVSRVLYKPENLHGARGPTFLVQDPMERTGKRRLLVLDVNCRRIGSFGLWATDWPYGARYYQKTGGSGHTPRRLRQLARRAGSTAILVEAVGGRWIRIENPMQRQGSVLSG